MTDAGRRLGLTGVFFGGPFANSPLEPPHSPARRHCRLLRWKEEVGFLEVSVPLDSYGGGVVVVDGLGSALHLAWAPWLPAPAGSG